MVESTFVNTLELDILFSGSRGDGHATPPTNSENRGSHSSWVGGGWVQRALIGSSRDGRFNKGRTERGCGEDRQAVLLFPLLVDVQSCSEVKDSLAKLKFDENTDDTETSENRLRHHCVPCPSDVTLREKFLDHSRVEPGFHPHKPSPVNTSLHQPLRPWQPPNPPRSPPRNP